MIDIHKETTLESYSKKQLIELIKVLEHNNKALNDTLQIQYLNAITIMEDIEQFKLTDKARNIFFILLKS